MDIRRCPEFRVEVFRRSCRLSVGRWFVPVSGVLQCQTGSAAVLRGGFYPYFTWTGKEGSHCITNPGGGQYPRHVSHPAVVGVSTCWDTATLHCVLREVSRRTVPVRACVRQPRVHLSSTTSHFTNHHHISPIHHYHLHTSPTPLGVALRFSPFLPSLPPPPPSHPATSAHRKRRRGRRKLPFTLLPGTPVTLLSSAPATWTSIPSRRWSSWVQCSGKG